MRTTLALSVMFLLASAGAQAFDQDASTAESFAPRVEATPFIAYRAGGTFDIPDSTQNADAGEHISYGFALDYRADDGASYELFFSRQPTRVTLGPQASTADLEVEYLMVGGTLVIEETSRVSPYVIALMGIGRFSLDVPEAEEDNRFAVSLGVGLRLPVWEHVDIRLEARGYVTFVSSDSALFCRADAAEDGCQLRGNGSVFPQFEALAGIAWSF